MASPDNLNSTFSTKQGTVLVTLLVVALYHLYKMKYKYYVIKEQIKFTHLAN